MLQPKKERNIKFHLEESLCRSMIHSFHGYDGFCHSSISCIIYCPLDFQINLFYVKSHSQKNHFQSCNCSTFGYSIARFYQRRPLSGCLVLFLWLFHWINHALQEEDYHSKRVSINLELWLQFLITFL